MSGKTGRPDGAPRRARTHLNYGEAIERQRRERGMTREALAEASGVSASYLSEVERGFKRPSTDVLARVAEALGRSPSEMLAYVEVLSEALPAAMPAAIPEAPLEATREWVAGRQIIEGDTPQSPRSERGSLRALLTVLEYLSEDDLRILLALARRLAGRGG